MVWRAVFEQACKAVQSLHSMHRVVWDDNCCSGRGGVGDCRLPAGVVAEQTILSRAVHVCICKERCSTVLASSRLPQRFQAQRSSDPSSLPSSLEGVLRYGIVTGIAWR
jgi:hypothetical protein